MTTSPNWMLSSLLGHSGRCFDVRFSDDGLNLLSASEDGTAVIWDAEKLRASAKVLHSKDAEVLRACFFYNQTICTCGADGRGLIWQKTSAPSSSSGKKTYRKVGILSHEDSQIYACEPLAPSSNRFLTAAENCIYIWDLERMALDPKVSMIPISRWSFDSLPNEDISSDTGVASLGGPRNPDDISYVFDAKVCPSLTGRVALAMSDGSVRLVDSRDGHAPDVLALPLARELAQCMLPGRRQLPSHVTSVGWSSNGLSLLASLGSGLVAVLDVRKCGVRAVLQAHRSGCFGASFLPNAITSSSELTSESCCLTWSSDCSIKIWDVSSDGILNDPIKSIDFPEYPVYSCASTLVPQLQTSLSFRPLSSNAEKDGVSDECIIKTGVPNWCTAPRGECSTYSVNEEIEKGSAMDSCVIDDKDKEVTYVSRETSTLGKDDDTGSNRAVIQIAVGGGDGSASFVGTPISLVSIPAFSLRSPAT